MIEPLLKHVRRSYDPFVHDEAPAPPQTLGAFMRWALAEYRWTIVALALATLAFGAMDVWAAWYLGHLIDVATRTGPEAFWAENAWPLIGGIVVFLFIRPAAYIAQSVLMSLLIGPYLFMRVVWRLHRHTLGQSLSFFQDDFAGRLASKQIQTGGSLTMGVLDVVMSFGLLLTYSITMIAVFLSTDWRLAVATLIWLLLFAAFVATRLKPIRTASRARAEARAVINGRFVDSFTNMTTVKLFAHAGREEDFARKGIERFADTTETFALRAIGVRTGIAIINAVACVAVIGLALFFWQNGSATLGALGAATAMILRATQMSGWVAWSAVGIFDHIGTVEDGAQTLSVPHDLKDRKDASALSVTTGAIRLEELRFAYGRDAGGIHGVSLDIKPGERVGLVGRSGAGKSTLVNLLLRLYDAEAGRIFIDGTDIRDVTQESLRRNIAMVTQDTAMFNRSALDNILYGNPEAGEAAAREAAAQARALDFILDLRDREDRSGFDAHIGERGVKLSGGQRQRIAIARAILKNAPILLLDEATSALDSEVEAEIQEELMTLMQGKTVIAIAHRLSTIAHLDRIVVLDDGRIAEDGTHEGLLARGGLYAGFWQRQSGGFLGLAAE